MKKLQTLSVRPTKVDLPIPVTITEIIDENPVMKTFVFDAPIESQAAQFIMLWIPKIDAKPFSVAYKTKTGFAVTAKAIGPFTNKLFELKVGDTIGYFGPYGEAWDLKKYKKILLVGGGVGAPAILSLAQVALDKEIEVECIIAARNKDEVLYEKLLSKWGAKVHIATDDGSLGFKGFATDLLNELLKENKFDCIYTCGPEVMMKKVAEIAIKQKISCQMSLERYMKCGFNICGQCCVDGTGETICSKGTVYDAEYVLKNITEFGKYHRDASGAKHYF
ncbi:MAG: dihydroorotate dehydrogenase electron transfer subunit [Candidatus Buchananbacteria bacterium CG10_big_fil_rev_8_21_14_0_10_42_9]|uniref:Dihydroorotate dehydrogenase electron transfer subunit n=1 Tax=Candidatus Buchananbacteria bacterium CG10_big_fil_rev_8_21_14_0_10_42_9 TaxID=1974526 RepID=A0A2H0W4W2_9BACT|nr:MAG: dihydroorotate dehydrogenase electron transfer subunit [Candidatus Buchananbacteria bacterium CG10_big_fil_rev_8_21_14_0_10_42_9]